MRTRFGKPSAPSISSANPTTCPQFVPMSASYPAFRTASASKPLWPKTQSWSERRNNLNGKNRANPRTMDFPWSLLADGRSPFSKGHRPNDFFHFCRIHHDDGVPRTAIQEAAVRSFADTLLATDTQNRIHLDTAEGRMVFIRNPEHAVFHRAVFDARRRSSTPRAALRDHGKFFGFFLARCGDALGARLVL